MAAMSILFVRYYLQYLSIELYGIIGFFSSLQAVLTLLDGGISPALSREIARLSAVPGKEQEMRDVSRTLETLCWLIALAVGGIAFLVSPLVAKYWLQSDQIPVNTIYHALVLMSISLIFQWTINFYTGGLIGLQRQTAYNVVNVIGVTLRSVGAYLVLAFVSPTIQAFLLWQLVTSLLTVILMAAVYWKYLPKTSSRAKFRFDLLKNLWRYAAGMTGIGVVALILTQSDKLILSRLLTLEYFGYYTLATTLANTVMGVAVGSIGSAFFPQYSQLVARDDISGLRELYHRSCQAMSVFLLPIMVMLTLFSFETLRLYTGNAEIAANTYILLSLIAIGFGFNGLMTLPYFIQLAFGVTKLAFYINVGAIIILIPFMIFATAKYGAVGGAITWAALNILYVVVGLQFMHRIMLQGELKKWYVTDVGIPLASVLIVASVFRIIMPDVTSPFHIFMILASISAVLFFTCILVLPQIREISLYQLNKLLKA